jgi:hypothetical protein
MVARLKDGLTLIYQYRTSYLVLNAVYYALIGVGMLIAVADPQLNEALLQGVQEAFSSGLLGEVANAYIGRKIVLAAILTFVENLTLGSFVSITLPSMVIPFCGLLVGCYRALIWGIMFAPITPEFEPFFWPHMVCLVLEGQAYVLVMLAAYIQGRTFLSPRLTDAQNRWQGYRAGLRFSGKIYMLVVIVLGIAAVYEALEIILISSNR